MPPGTTLHLVSHAANGHHVSIVIDRDAEPEIVAVAHERLLAEAQDDSTFGASWSELARPEVVEAPVTVPVPREALG